MKSQLQLAILFVIFFIHHDAVLSQNNNYCENLYFFRDGGTPGIIDATVLSSITGYQDGEQLTVTDLCTLPAGNNKNGLAANPVDGNLYYQRILGANDLRRINPNNCTDTYIGELWNALGWTSNTGCFDHLGRYWCIRKQPGNVSRLLCYNNIISGPPNLLYNYNITGLLDAPNGDLSYNFKDCLLYIANNDTVQAFDTMGNKVLSIGPGLNEYNITTNYGGMTVGIDGHLYVMNNAENGTGNQSYLIRFNTDLMVSEGIIDSILPGANLSSSDMASFPCSNIDANFGVSTNSGCAPFSPNLIDSSIGLISNWYWDFGDGHTDSARNPNHTYASSGNYTIRLIATPLPNTCYTIEPDTFWLDVEVLSPDINITNDTSICIGNSLLLNAEDATHYIWSPSKGLDDPTSPTPTASPNKTTLYKLSVIDSLFCTAKDSVLITVNNPPLVDFPQSISVNSGGNVTIEGDASHDYLWNPGIWLNDSTIYNPTFTAGESQIYSVTVTDSNGCSSTYNINVIVIKEAMLYIPNAFTPNGDDLNDHFRINATGTSNEILRIYDRSGTLLYQTSNLSQGWNGKKDNILYANGSYVYHFTAKATIDGSIIDKKGLIELVR